MRRAPDFHYPSRRYLTENIMARYAMVLLSVLFVLSAFVISGKAEEEHKPVKAKIIADVSAISPGASFELAVLLEIDPRWHIYWKNPGDSGLPTSVEFELPQGFQVGGIRWPVPSILKGAGNLTDYGYEDSLLLSVVVTAPPGLKSGSTVEIEGNVSWVSCKDICIPGRAKLELELPVSDTSEGVNAALFSEWRSRLPVNYSGNKPPFKIGVKSSAKDGNETSVSILLDSADGVSGVDLYPVTGNLFIVNNIVVESDKSGGKTSISFDVKKLESKGTSGTELETLIVYTDKSGKRSGFELPVNLGRAE